MENVLISTRKHRLLFQLDVTYLPTFGQMLWPSSGKDMNAQDTQFQKHEQGQLTRCSGHFFLEDGQMLWTKRRKVSSIKLKQENRVNLLHLQNSTEKCPCINLVGPKCLKKFKRLMMQRMKWNPHEKQVDGKEPIVADDNFYVLSSTQMKMILTQILCDPSKMLAMLFGKARFMTGHSVTGKLDTFQQRDQQETI